MKSKVISGVSWAVIGLIVLCFQFTPAMGIFIMFFSIIANYEILTTAQVTNKGIIALSCAVAVLLPPTIEYGFFSKIPFSPIVLLLMYVFILFVMMLKGYSHTRFEQVPLTIFSSVFIPFAMTSMMLVRDMYKVTGGDPFTKSNCSFLVTMALLCSWMTDALAYFAGSQLGKHKMSPQISPKKSWEGAIGGVLGTIAVNMLVWTAYWILAKFNYITPLFIPIWIIPILSAVLSVVAMLGDLSASAIKRNYGIKDFGKIMGKGNGGVMDRFDSASFAVPAMYVIVLLYNTFR